LAGDTDLTDHIQKISPGLIVLLALMLAACGGQPRKVSGEFPLVNLDGLSLSNGSIGVDIGIRNINDSPLELPAMAFRLMLDGQLVAERNDQAPSISIAARGREVLRLQSDINPSGRQLLEELDRGERSNLAYQLELEFEAAAGNAAIPKPAASCTRSPGSPDDSAKPMGAYWPILIGHSINVIDSSHGGQTQACSWTSDFRCQPLQAAVEPRLWQGGLSCDQLHGGNLP
jgi:LEA14-like dessication related protein